MRNNVLVMRDHYRGLMWGFLMSFALCAWGFHAMAQSTRPVEQEQVVKKPLEALHEKMESLREEAGLPALGVLVIQDGEIKARAVVGVREINTDIKAQINDQFHLGSCTKAMTATLIARLVEKKKLKWEDTLEKHFPEYAETMPQQYRKVNLIQLLAHRSGLPANLPDGVNWSQIYQWKGSLQQKRQRYTRLILHSQPKARAEAYLYSNAGYTIAGFIAEKVTGKSYETLMEEEVFKPLGMVRTGFGPAGYAGRGDQPRAHYYNNGQVKVLRARHPYADNHAIISAAGRAHMPMSEWAKFVNYHATSGKSHPDYLTKDSLRMLHRAYPDEAKTGRKTYALGWGIGQRRWAGGKILNHSGTNKKNYCVTWVSLKYQYAVLVATNIRTPKTDKACDDLVGYMIRHFPPVQD